MGHPCSHLWIACEVRCSSRSPLAIHGVTTKCICIYVVVQSGQGVLACTQVPER